MGTPRLGEEASLCALPEDVHLQILDLLPPAQIAVFAELSRATRASAASPTVWASVARRHLGVVVGARPPATPASVAALARGLLCRWWLATGLFVPGVPVHRRSGFVAARARGGLEVPLASDPDASPDTAYVFGGRHAARSTPAAAPAVELDFALDPAGPFPVDGLVLRLQHAAELPAADHSAAAAANPSAATANTDAGAPTTSPVTPAPAGLKDTDCPAAAADASTAAAAAAAGSPAQAPAAQAAPPSPPPRARIRVEVNNACIADVTVDASRDFATLEVPVAASALVAKPGLNMMAVRYDRAESTTGYWLRDVTVCPAVLPLPAVSAAAVPAASTVDGAGAGERNNGAGLGLRRYRGADAAAARELWSAPSPSSSSSSSSPPPPPPPQRERGSSPRQVPGGGRHERSRNSNSSSNSRPSSPRAVRGGGGGGHGMWSAGAQAEVAAAVGRAAKGKTPGAKARTPKHKYHQHQHHQRSPRTTRTRAAR